MLDSERWCLGDGLCVLSLALVAGLWHWCLLLFFFCFYYSHCHAPLLLTWCLVLAWDFFLQVTLDIGNTRFYLMNQSGRGFLNQGFKLWKNSSKGTVATSFNSSFVLNIVPKTGNDGDDLAFIITNGKDSVPDNSYGQYLGLFNSTTNGYSKNRLVAVEFDTRKNNANDPDDNHVRIDVNRIKSLANASVSYHNIILKRQSDIVAWVQYDGGSKLMRHVECGIGACA
jgi:hypothetical protein